MDDKEFKNEIKKGLVGGYLLYGDEEYLKKYYLKEAVESVVGRDDAFSAFNTVTIEDDAYSAAALEDALSTVPMMAEKVCVVCNVRLSSLKEKEKKDFCDVLSSYDKSSAATLLVVCPQGTFDAGNVKKNRPSPLYKTLSKYIAPVEFAYRTAPTLKNWVRRHFEKEGLYTDDTVLSYIVETSGPDMFTLGSDTEKLICYTASKGEKSVTLDAARRLCSDNGESDAFAMTNAIVSGDRAAALEALKEAKEKRLKAPYVLSKITGDFANMLTVALYMSSGMTKSEIASETGLHEFRVSRYMDAARKTDTAALKAALDRCREADVTIKTSGVDYMALERLLCTMPSKKGVRSLR